MARHLGSRYVLESVLGRGSFGEVWRGRDTDGNQLAFKILHPSFAEDSRAVEKFVQERSILITLDHPNLVRVHDMIMEGGTLALVMDLIDGGDLRKELRARGKLPEAEACELALGVAAGLGAIHSKGYIHRDIKPENTLLDISGSGSITPRVTDFGISRLSAAADRSTVLTGTPSYVAPELFDERRITSAVDLYSLGIMLYELVTGAPPFRSESVLALMRMHMEADPQRPQEMSSEVWDLVSTLLAKDPLDRGGSASSIEDALRTISSQLSANANRPDPHSPTDDTLPTIAKIPDAHKASTGEPTEPYLAVHSAPTETDTPEEESESVTTSTPAPQLEPTPPELDDPDPDDPDSDDLDDSNDPDDRPSIRLDEPETSHEGIGSSIRAGTRKLALTRSLFTVGEDEEDPGLPSKRRKTFLGVSVGLVVALVASTGIGIALNMESPTSPIQQPNATKTCWDGSKVADSEACPGLVGEGALTWYAGLDPDADEDLVCVPGTVSERFRKYIEAVSCTWKGASKIDGAFVFISRWPSSELALDVTHSSLALGGPVQKRVVDGRTRLYREVGDEVFVNDPEGKNSKRKPQKIWRVVDIYSVAPVSVSMTAYGDTVSEALGRFQDVSRRVDLRDNAIVEAALSSARTAAAESTPSSQKRGQNGYFVAAHDGHVAICLGDYSHLPKPTSADVEEVTGIRLSALSSFRLKQVTDGIEASNRDDADLIVDELRLSLFTTEGKDYQRIGEEPAND